MLDTSHNHITAVPSMPCNAAPVLIALPPFDYLLPWLPPFFCAGWMGYQAERSRFLEAVSGGATDSGMAAKLNAVVYGGDR